MSEVRGQVLLQIVEHLGAGGRIARRVKHRRIGVLEVYRHFHMLLAQADVPHPVDRVLAERYFGFAGLMIRVHSGNHALLGLLSGGQEFLQVVVDLGFYLFNCVCRRNGNYLSTGGLLRWGNLRLNRDEVYSSNLLIISLLLRRRRRPDPWGKETPRFPFLKMLVA